MSKTREAFQQMLEGFQIEVGETPHVYYQPPETIKMSYPCFIYVDGNVDRMHSGNNVYLTRFEYDVTYITRDAEPVLVEAMKQIPKTRFVRHFTSDNLHHFVFTMSGMWKRDATEADIEKIAKNFLGGN